MLSDVVPSQANACETFATRTPCACRGEEAVPTRRASAPTGRILERATPRSVSSRRHSARSCLEGSSTLPSGARSILAKSCTLPPRAPSRDRLGIGFGSQLDLELNSLEDRDNETCSRVVPDPGSIQARLDYAEHMSRRRATSMLCLGAVFGMLGFLVAASLGMWLTYQGRGLNLDGHPFPSGEAYWPSSVSEMVNDPTNPSGKCWMCFELLAALCIWLSWYPWELRNVYVGGDLKFFGVPFLHWRAFVPPFGLLMVVLIPLSTRDDFANSLASAIHLIGAVMMLGGHGLFEVYTLACAEFVRIGRRERQLRWIWCICCLVAGLGFAICGQLLEHSKGSLCCGDVLRIPTDDDIESARANGHTGLALRNAMAQETGEALLFDTAAGTILFLKYLRYWCEVAAGFSMIFGLITIWYFCPERRLELGNELPGKYCEKGDEGDATNTTDITFMDEPSSRVPSSMSPPPIAV